MPPEHKESAACLSSAIKKMQEEFFEQLTIDSHEDRSECMVDCSFGQASDFLATQAERIVREMGESLRMEKVDRIPGGKGHRIATYNLAIDDLAKRMADYLAK